MTDQPKWERIVDTARGGFDLERIAVPGGWLYRTRLHASNDDGGVAITVAMCFVPEPASMVRIGPTDHYAR